MNMHERRQAMRAIAAIALGVTCMAAFAAASISGTATYRERMLLPPGAVFEATLEDVSRADVPSTVIGRARIDNPGSPPFRFSIACDPALVQAGHRYAVRARITRDGQVMFVTDTAHAVLGPGNPTEVDIMLRRTSAHDASASGSAGAASLENTYWKLTRLPNAQVQVVEPQREPHLILQSAERRVAGSSGCNRLAGGYTLDGDRLALGRMASTMMACPQGMEQERAFLDALATVERWRVTGQELTLVDARGEVVAQFESRYMK
jgi:putative lipoprotein